MKKIIYIKKLSFLIGFLFATSFSFGQNIFSNPINSSPYTAGQNIAPNTTASGIDIGPLVIGYDNYNAYRTTNWDGATLNPNKYLEFTMTPDAGYALNFTSFVLNSRVNFWSTSNVASVQFDSSLDGFTTTYVTNIGPNTITGTSTTTVDLSAAAFQNITSSITFRLYIWGPTTADQAFVVEDFAFNGDVVALASCVGTTVTWNGTVWTPIPPVITSNVIINGDYNTFTDGSFSACSLTVNSGFTLDIADNTYVEVENDATVQTGATIMVQPYGAFVQNNDSGTVTNNGLIRVVKTTAPLNAWYEYTYWSSPVSNITVDNGLFGSDPSRRFVYNGLNYLDAMQETANNNTLVAGQDDIDDNGDDWLWVNGSSPMQPGIGYAATHNETFFTGPPMSSPPYQFDYIFEGDFNNGVCDIPVYRNDFELYDNNWNLIGNPYPSAIDADLFLAANNNIEGAISLWSQNTAPSSTANGNEQLNFSDADYAVINGSGESAGGDGLMPNRFIPSGQAFFVSMSNSAPTATLVSGDIYTANVTFNNSMRVFGATDNSQFFKSSSSKNKTTSNSNKIWIDLTSDNGVFNQILVAYVDGATNNDDGAYFDARKIVAPTAYAALYSTIENSDKKFVIQGKATNSLNADEVINLGFSTNIDVATLYTLSIAQFEGDFLNNNPVFLKDNLLNTVHELSASDYTFTSETGVFNERFEVMFSAASLSTNVLALNSKSLKIIELENDDVQFTTSDNLNIKTVNIFDLLGRQLHSFKGNNASEIYSLSNLSSSVFIAKVELSNGAVITKKAVKK